MVLSARSRVVSRRGRGALRRSLVGSLWLVLPLFGLALLAFAAFGASDQRTVVSLLISVIAVVGLGTFSGNSGVLSFGHAGFVAIGAYLGALLVMSPAEKAISVPDLPGFLADVHLSVPLAALATAIVVALLALPPGIVIARMAPAAAVLGTFALLVIVEDVLTGAREITRGSQTFFGVPPIASLMTCASFATVAVVAARVYRDSAYGVRLRASRDDALAASAAGIDIAAQRLRGWALSAALCAVSGLLLGAFIGAFSPKAFGLGLTFQLIAMLLVGGWTTVSGAVLGAALITLLTTLLQDVAAGPGPLPEFLSLTEIGLSVAILLVLFVRRDGLMGRRELDEHFAAWRRRRAERGKVAAATPVPPPAAATAVDRGDTATPPAGAAAPAGSLVVKGMAKAFDGLHVLGGVDVEARPGEILGVIGPNGSGKTTLLNTVTGVVAPDAGEVWLGDRQLTGLAVHRIARAGLARTFQNIRLFATMTVADNVRPVAVPEAKGLVPDERVEALLARFGLADVAEREAGTLSYGAQRRLEIARALAAEPRFLLLDEPAAGLNDDESDELLETLARIRDERGLGIFIIDHDLRLMLRLCDRIVVLHRGAVIADGPPEQIRDDPKVVSAYMGSRAARTAVPLEKGK
jgi:branched-chain amino acid transport system permease protein